MESTAYGLLGIVAAVAAAATVLALVVGFPFSIIAILVGVALVLLFWQALGARPSFRPSPRRRS